MNWARAAAVGIFAFSLLFGFAGLYVLIRDQGRSPRPSESEADLELQPLVEEARQALANLPAAGP